MTIGAGWSETETAPDRSEMTAEAANALLTAYPVAESTSFNAEIAELIRRLDLVEANEH